jgi:hypothetical protein
MHFRSETPKTRVRSLHPASWCDGRVPGGRSSVPHGRRVPPGATPRFAALNYIMTGAFVRAYILHRCTLDASCVYCDKVGEFPGVRWRGLQPLQPLQPGHCYGSGNLLLQLSTM